LRGLEEKLNEKDIYKIIAKNIRKERIKNNLTLEELSEKAQISVSFLSYIEKNKKIPSIKTIEKISKGLNIPVYKLFQTEQDKREKDNIKEFLDEITPSQKKFIKKFLELLSSKI
jgi:transcriptional regulator with XRE-family HTH domain